MKGLFSWWFYRRRDKKLRFSGRERERERERERSESDLIESGFRGL